MKKSLIFGLSMMLMLSVVLVGCSSSNKATNAANGQQTNQSMGHDASSPEHKEMKP